VLLDGLSHAAENERGRNFIIWQLQKWFHELSSGVGNPAKFPAFKPSESKRRKPCGTRTLSCSPADSFVGMPAVGMPAAGPRSPRSRQPDVLRSRHRRSPTRRG
jgi:hypothetical protein